MKYGNAVVNMCIPNYINNCKHIIYTIQKEKEEREKEDREQAKRDAMCPAFFSRFISNYLELQKNNTIKPIHNQNTDAIFSNAASYTARIMRAPEDSSRLFTNKWKRRKLICTVPLSIDSNETAQVLINYDPVKRGFCYVCSRSLSYYSLNIAAMHYVKMFCCVDLFMDTQFCPAFRSPLLDIYAKYEYDEDNAYKQQNEKQLMMHASLYQKQRRLKDAVKKQEQVQKGYKPPEHGINYFTRYHTTITSNMLTQTS